MNDIENQGAEVQTPAHRDEVNRDIRVKTLQQQQIFKRLKAQLLNPSQLSLLSATNLEIKLSLVESNFESLKELQTQLEFLDETRLQEDHRSEFEETYCAVKSLLVDKLSQLRTVDLDENLTSTRVPHQPISSLRPRVNLPKLQLPTFTGLHREWLDFYNMFSVLVHNNVDLSNIEKFQYLRSSLSGNAARLVQSLEVTDSNYLKAFDLLTARFDNKRYFFQSHLQHIFDTQKISNANISSLRDFIDTVNANMRAMQSMATKPQIADGIVLHLVVSKLDPETQSKWEEEIASKWARNSSSNALALPSWEDLSTFLERRCQTIDMIEANQKSTKSQQSSHSNAVSSSSKSRIIHKQSSFIATNQQRCHLCNEAVSHNAFKCAVFMKLDPMERYNLAKRKNLCLNCLCTNHTSSACPSTNRCQHCRVSHHTLLHRGQQPQQASTSSIIQPATSTVLQVQHIQSDVVIATALVQLFNPMGVSIIARALLDSASQLHFVTERTAQFLRVTRKKVPMEINGIGSCATNAQQVCSIEVKSLYYNFSSTIEAVVMPTITLNQPQHTNFNKPGSVDLLLGAGLFYELLLVGQIKFHNSLPTLQKTKLGWIVSGAITNRTSTSSSSASKKSSSHNTRCSLLSSSSSPSAITISNTPSIDSLLEKFWQLEHNFHQTSGQFSPEEEECEKYFQQTTRRCPTTNKFIVRLPFKENPTCLGQSYEIARKRLLSIESKMQRDSELRKNYCDFVGEYSDLNHMILVSPQEASKKALNFIPHHCVTKLDSSTTKLRVVFYASCRTSNGKSLNSILRVGPTIQDNIFTILTRFRTHPFVLMADITKMYRQVIVDEDDAKWQCILWRDSASDSISVYQLQTITYGTSCAPFLATKCLQQIAIENSTAFPIGAEVTLRDFYVDNLMTGGSTIQEVVEIKKQVIELLSSCGFPLRKFASNDSRIIEDIQSSDKEEIVNLNDVEYIKALGLKWSPEEDCFLFTYTHHTSSSKASKRIILSHIASFFDPLGLLNPVIVTCKILMQQLWKLKLDWDESVPPEVHMRWETLCNQFVLVENFRVPRFVPFYSYSHIHAFADASTKAYGACIYAVTEFGDTKLSSLICAKSRVAPTKEVSLPRLELCAALLLAELLETVAQTIAPNPQNVYCWSDSTITLAWIKGESSRWTPFVANRVTKIQQMTSEYQWRHVPTSLNPADIVSRGSTVCDLIDNKFWFNGPEFLLLDSTNWPSVSTDITDDLPEQRRQHNVLIADKSIDFIAQHKYINSYNKLIRIFTYVRRFIASCRKESNSIKTGPITAEEMNDTLHVICRRVQHFSFAEEIKSLQSNLPVSCRSSLAQLSPFLNNGLLRVGGRIKNSALSYDAKHPILLPKSHPFTSTLIEHFHRQNLHAGCQTLQSILRDKFWINNARNTIKQVLHKCIICYRCRPILAEQIMGSLPRDRVVPSLPFEVTGVDYCGPFLMTQQIRGKAPIKAYIAVFICFTTKAVHLELVPDLTTSAFITAFKRFIARRGKCRKIYSDNATNFVGANRELRELLKDFMSQQHIADVQQSCSQLGIEWSFIPPRSPHFGGLWESAVKQAKYYLRRTIGLHILSHDELHTVCCQAEAMVNSRPLTPLSSDPDDLRPLTPAHFLVGRTLNTIPEPSLSHLKVGLLKRYQLVQKIQQQFWERWSTEYLKELQQKTKWRTPIVNLKANDLVLLKDEGTPPLKWPMGRIVESIQSSDGQVRVVVVKTADGTVKRAIAKICKLPIDI